MSKPSGTAHLWAIGYEDGERAGQVKDEIIRLGWGESYLSLTDVAVVVRNPDGSFTVNRLVARESRRRDRPRPGRERQDPLRAVLHACHGEAGAPGKAAVDLRTYVARHGGKFPAADWLAIMADSRPGSVHADVWERIRREQSGGADASVAARATVGQIARYVNSIQSKAP